MHPDLFDFLNIFKYYIYSFFAPGVIEAFKNEAFKKMPFQFEQKVLMLKKKRGGGGGGGGEKKKKE